MNRLPTLQSTFRRKPYSLFYNRTAGRPFRAAFFMGNAQVWDTLQCVTGGASARCLRWILSGRGVWQTALLLGKES